MLKAALKNPILALVAGLAVLDRKLQAMMFEDERRIARWELLYLIPAFMLYLCAKFALIGPWALALVVGGIVQMLIDWNSQEQLEANPLFAAIDGPGEPQPTRYQQLSLF